MSVENGKGPESTDCNSLKKAIEKSKGGKFRITYPVESTEKEKSQVGRPCENGVKAKVPGRLAL